MPREAAGRWGSDLNAPGTGPIRLLLVDCQPSVRRGIKMRLALEPDLEVVGEACDAAEAISLARALVPDVILMDLSMPVFNGLDATRLLREVVPSTAIVIFSAFETADLKRQAYEAGAVAYLPKGCSNERLRATLEAAVTVVGSNLRRA
ncbi:MAG: response regulator [Thermoleophilia bacterium]